MEELVQRIREYLESAGSSPGLLEYAVLALGAMLEYVFPPFPGDVVILLGAILVGKYDWSMPAVCVAVSAGSALGLSLDYAFGVWVRHRDASWRAKYRLWARLGNSIDRFDAFYRRWGALCILVNRFVPAVRAIFFVGAGMAGIQYWKTLVLGLASAMIWNLLIFVVGVSVGNKWDDLRAVLGTYSTVAWIIGIVAGLAVAVWWLRRRRLLSRQAGSPARSEGAGPASTGE